MEEACTRCLPKETEELRADSSQLLRNNCPPPKPNLTLEECRAIKEPKEDHSWVVLTADKGVAMAVMDKEEYTDNAHSYWQALLPTVSSIRTLPPNLEKNTCPDT